MKILLVGLSVRSMMESAVHSGYQATALDAFGDRDLKLLGESHSLHHDFHSVYSPNALYKASRMFAFDAVSYTSNLENHPQILDRFAECHQIIGNSPQVIRSVRHWPSLFSGLKSAGFSVPETFFAGEIQEVDDTRQWLIKPVLSGGGHGIAFLDPRAQFLFRKANNYGVPGFMLQEYIAGKPCSASFVANGSNCVVLGIAEQLIGLNQFGSHGLRYCGNIFPLPEMLIPELRKAILEQVTNTATFLTRKHGLSGVNGMDFILRGDQIFLTEVNPRYSASMELIFQAFGLPLFSLHASAVLDGRLPLFHLNEELRGGEFFGKAILFAERDARAPNTKDWFARDIRDVPESGETLRKGGPICTLLAHAPTYHETFAELTGKARALKEEIYGQTEFDIDYRTFYQAGHRDLDREGMFRLSGSHQRD
jgi:predicted ATP-grasp superfamily ATP-dependent carboligase